MNAARWGEVIGSGAFGGLLTFLFAWYWFVKNARVKAAAELATEAKALTGRIIELEKQMHLIEKTIVPGWIALQAKIVEELTHLHTPVTDALLVKIGPPNTLTDEETGQLVHALEERSRSADVPEAERDAAVMLPLVMKRAKQEQEEVAAGRTPQFLHIASVFDALRAIRTEITAHDRWERGTKP
jgi:hypothetical protein